MAATSAGADSSTHSRTQLTSDHLPILMLEIELSEPLTNIAARQEGSEAPFGAALALVRIHSHPIGLVELQLPADGLTAEECAQAIWHRLRTPILSHLGKDGLSPVGSLPPGGLEKPGWPPCLLERQVILAAAPLISVIIPTRDRPDHLHRCLEALLSSSYPNFEVIVVDNAPRTDATASLFEAEYRQTGRVKYVLENRSGSSAARNKGLESANGEIVAFTDDDVLVDRFWLLEIAKAFETTNNVGCVTGLIIPLELQTRPQLWFEQYGGFSKGFERRIYDLDENRPSNPIYPYNAGGFGSGNNMAFKKAVLDVVGGFDPTLGNGTPSLGGVDVEAFLRVVVRGYRLVYEPGAIVHHVHRRDYAGLRSQVYNYGVGMTALLTKTLISEPSLILDFVRKIPAGIRFALSSASPLNVRKGDDYPSELTRLDRLGMLYGPIAYIRSWIWWHLSQQTADRG